MDKERLKKYKILYYPLLAVKNTAYGTVNCFHYKRSLNYIKRNKEKVQEKIKKEEVINVVFLIQYIPGWNKLEPIYTKMQRDDRFNPLIVCVPLSINNNIMMNNNCNDTFEYFINNGYEAIDALQSNGDWYDLKQLNPDYVFHSRPYNHFMPKPYTSGKIVKYALICNVMYGTYMTTNELDITLNKNYFRDTYTYYSLDKGEKDFYENRFKLGIRKGIQKCQSFGTVGMEQVLESKKAKENNMFIKTVIWTPRWSTDLNIGGSNFFNYKDVMIRLAKDYQEILFIFRPHPLMFGNFIKNGEMSQKDVNDFKKYCENENNIFLDETKEYMDTFWNSDFLITDMSGLVTEYFITEKPIIYCHTSASFKYVDYAKNIIKTCYEANNEKELIQHFSNLINDNDTNLNLRLDYIEEYFGDVKNNSSYILDSLVNDSL